MKKIRLFALVGALGFVALTGAQAGPLTPIEPLCMCACPDGTIICVSAMNGDCAVPCQKAMRDCPSGS
jgi:hypothetical protein